MSEDRHERCAERLSIAFELFDAALAIRRAQLARRHPDEAIEQIEQRLTDWIGLDWSGRPRDPASPEPAGTA